jgi:hypothetical protein
MRFPLVTAKAATTQFFKKCIRAVLYIRIQLLNVFYLGGLQYMS